jgi:hypothetical protein
VPPARPRCRPTGNGPAQAAEGVGIVPACVDGLLEVIDRGGHIVRGGPTSRCAARASPRGRGGGVAFEDVQCLERVSRLRKMREPPRTRRRETRTLRDRPSTSRRLPAECARRFPGRRRARARGRTAPGPHFGGSSAEGFLERLERARHRRAIARSLGLRDTTAEGQLHMRIRGRAAGGWLGCRARQGCPCRAWARPMFTARSVKSSSADNA